MSTTDTRAAFEAWALEHGFNLNFGPDGKNYISGHTQSIWEPWQAATEAAKATGKAGEQTKQSFENIEELPPLPECAYVQHGPFANRDLFTVAQMREYGQACAEAARQPAPVSIKTWQERAEGKVLPEIRRFITDAVWAEQNYMEMLAEIADLRAALALRSQP